MCDDSLVLIDFVSRGLTGEEEAERQGNHDEHVVGRVRGCLQCHRTRQHCCRRRPGPRGRPRPKARGRGPNKKTRASWRPGCGFNARERSNEFQMYLTLRGGPMEACVAPTSSAEYGKGTLLKSRSFTNSGGSSCTVIRRKSSTRGVYVDIHGRRDGWVRVGDNKTRRGPSLAGGQLASSDVFGHRVSRW